MRVARHSVQPEALP